MFLSNEFPAWRAGLLAAGAALTFAACGESTGPSGREPHPPITTLPRALNTAEQQAIVASNQFGLGLLREVAAEASGQNVVLSPLSASIALGMAYVGASDSTERAMRAVLGWDATTASSLRSAFQELPALLTSLDPSVQVTLANGAWVREGFPLIPTYVTDVEQTFASKVKSADFGPATVDAMNAWASAATNGRIPEVVESLSDDLVLMLMNALYFKGSWRVPFDVDQTRNAPFATQAGAVPEVPTMFRMDPALRAARTAGAVWAELPYGNTAYVMTLAMPDEGTTPAAWLADMDASTFSASVAQLAERRSEIGLPKFRLTAEKELGPMLSRLGMGVAFDRVHARFRNMTNAQVFISQVKQDVFIDVNEEGTEAAAVTQVGIELVSLPPSIHFNKPFVFFIRERLSGAILFAGVIEDPRG